MRRFAVAIVLGLGLSAPANAAPDDPLAGVAAPFVRGLVQERDVTLLFDYLRESLDAAADGRDPPSADRLAERADEIGAEAKRRGAVAGRTVLDAIERSVRDLLKDPPRRASAGAFSPDSTLQRTQF